MDVIGRGSDNPFDQVDVESKELVERFENLSVPCSVEAEQESVSDGMIIQISSLPKLRDHKEREIDILQAAEYGNLDLIKQFLRIDQSLINVQDDDGYTPLHRACYNRKINVIKFLIQNGANVCARTEDGWEPIHSAAQWGHIEVVRILLASGADINSKTNGKNSPLHLAVSKPENRPLIEYLLFRDDIDLDIRNNANDTAFDICKRNSMNYKLWELL